jgi:hypothetical protein
MSDCEVVARRPRSLYEIAKMRGVSRSIMTTAVKNPYRYPQARLFIESLLRAA